MLEAPSLSVRVLRYVQRLLREMRGQIRSQRCDGYAVRRGGGEAPFAHRDVRPNANAITRRLASNVTPDELTARIELLESRLERLVGIVTVLLESLRDGDDMQQAAMELRGATAGSRREG
jgi:hypothetical protein